MTDAEKAAKAIEALKAAEPKPPQAALKILNELVGLVHGGEEQTLAQDPAYRAYMERVRWRVVPKLF